MIRVDVCQLIPSFEFRIVPEWPTTLNNCGFDTALDSDSFLEHEIRDTKTKKN